MGSEIKTFEELVKALNKLSKTHATIFTNSVGSKEVHFGWMNAYCSSSRARFDKNNRKVKILDYRVTLNKHEKRSDKLIHCDRIEIKCENPNNILFFVNSVAKEINKLVKEINKLNKLDKEE